MTEERKLVTVLFADIVGSTTLTGAHDPEIVRAAMDAAFEGIAPVLVAHGGTVEKFIGDAVMAVFGVPAAHDDDAERAVRAAFGVRDAIASLDAPLPLEVRIGVNTGEAVTRSGAGDQRLVTGLAVNVAQRLQAAAQPGEILVGEVTHGLTRRAVRYGTARMVQAKGVGEITAFAADVLLDAVPQQRRGIEGLRAPLVGRDEEMALLLDSWQRCGTERRAALVTVFGAAGAGKSRLTEELVERIGPARVRQGRCLPYGEGITLYPVQVILRAEAGLVPSDDHATARRKIADLPRMVGSDDADALSARLLVLAGIASAGDALPDVPTEDIADELVWGLRRYFELRTTSEPIAVVVEDIHWAEPALLDLIEQLAEWTRGPIFILCLARPEFLERRPSWGGGKINSTNIVLEPLSADETRSLIGGLLAIDALAERTRGDVIARAEGNPLYVEEFLRLLIETGGIERREGRWVATGHALVDLPPSLHGLIAARLDQAPAELKSLLQRAAVVGRFFTTTGLAAISGGATPPSTLLRDAVRRDLLVEADDRGLAGGRVFRFKHVLIRDVAYGSVPKAERSRLHDTYGRWYEAALGERREEVGEIIAHHAEQAFLLAAEMRRPDLPDLSRRAADHLRAVGDRAKERAEWPSALSFYRRALTAADRAGASDAERLELRAAIAITRHVVEATPEAIADVDAMIEEARAAGRSDLHYDLLSSRHWQLDTGRDEARATLERLAAELDDPKRVVRAVLLGALFNFAVADARGYVERALVIAVRHGLVAEIAGCHNQLATILQFEGRLTESREHVEEYVRVLGAKLGRRERAVLLEGETFLAMNAGRFEQAVVSAWDLLAIVEELGNPRLVAGALGMLTSTLFYAGHIEEAREAAERRLGLLQGKVAPQRGTALRWWARILLESGDVTGARHAIDESVAIARSRGEAILAATLEVRALVEEKEGRAAEASETFEAAVAQVDRDGTVASLIRLDYAEFLMRRGRAAEARAALEMLRARLDDPLAAPMRDIVDGALAKTTVPGATLAPNS